MQQLVTQSLCAVGGKRDPSEDLQFLHCRYGVKLQAGFHLPGSGQITWTVSCFYPAVKQDCLKPLPPICAAPQRSVPHMVALVHPWCWWLAWCPLLNVQMRGLGWAWKRHWGRRWWNWEVVPRNAILETCPCIQGSLWSALSYFWMLDVMSSGSISQPQSACHVALSVGFHTYLDAHLGRCVFASQVLIICFPGSQCSATPTVFVFWQDKVTVDHLLIQGPKLTTLNPYRKCVNIVT